MAQPLTITNQQDKISATPYLSLLPDSSGNLTIEQVSSPDHAERFFAPAPDQYHSLLRETQTHVWWFRLEIQQFGDHNWYLIADTPTIGQLDAYIVDPSNWRIQPKGAMRLENSWQRLPTLRLPTKRGNAYQIYLRAGNQSIGAWRHLSFQLLSADALNQQTAHDYLFYGGIIMGLLALASYKLLLFSSLRNPSYLALVVLTLSLILVVQRAFNIIPWLSFFSNPDSLWFTASLHLLLISCLQFWRLLLDTQKLLPMTDRVATALSVLILGMTPFIHQLPDTEFWTFILIVLAAIFGIISGSIAMRRNPRIVRSIAPGFIVFVSSAMPITLWRLSLLEDADPALLNDIFAAGSLATGILLSLTLAEHTRQMRIKAEQAATESQVKDEFLTTLSHELRTPINSVVAVAELLKQGQLPAQEREYVSRLETASHHMLGLVNDILDLSRLQVAKITLHNETFQLSTLLNRLEQMLQASAAAKKLALHLYPPANPDLHLRGDPQRLSQVLLNLMGNAIKFTERGSVTLSVREMGGADNDAIHLCFEIMDTGSGITPEDQARLFQPFSQIDNQRTRRHGGSGLGLAISRKLVKAMGGKLELESSLGKGSRFFFTLVFAEPPVVEETPPILPLSGEGNPCTAVATTSCFSPDKGRLGGGSSKGRSFHILLVDDDEMNRFFGRELLNTLGVTTTVADSGAEAIQQLRQRPLDLIFMDVSMPEMDGYETTRRIRADPRFAKLPIIALTAHAIAGERERCLAAGMNDYLTKPLEPAQLQQAIYHWSCPDHMP
ncbi:MAG: response regulator [Thiothrix sp.]